MQCEENFQEQIFVEPCKEHGLDKEKILKLKNPLYGLVKSGNYWGRTLSQNLTENENVMQCTLNLAVYYKPECGNQIGLCAIYHKNNFHDGNGIFKNYTVKKKKV